MSTVRVSANPATDNPPRRHHYVPQFYLKKFAGGDEYLRMYDRETGKYARVHPRHICFANEAGFWLGFALGSLCFPVAL